VRSRKVAQLAIDGGQPCDWAPPGNDDDMGMDQYLLIPFLGG